MKKNLCIGAAALLMLAGCTPKATHQLVQPLPQGLTIESLSYATMHVAFSANDFDWEANTLRMKVYTEDLYDAFEVNHLQTGDTLIYDNNRIVVDSVTIDGSFITVNNGIEEGGANFVAHEGGPIAPCSSTLTRSIQNWARPPFRCAATLPSSSAEKT